MFGVRCNLWHLFKYSRRFKASFTKRVVKCSTEKASFFFSSSSSSELQREEHNQSRAAKLKVEAKDY